MVDSTIQRLLEKAIDSPIKLQLCLLFDENQRMRGSAAELANRIYNEPIERDAIQRALREVASYARYRRSTLGGAAFEMQSM